MKHIPMRSCIVCRQQKEKTELLRIARSPDGAFAWDVDGKQAGRGAYVCRSGECAQTALTKRSFNRVFKQEIPQQVYDTLQAEYDQIRQDGQKA